MSEAMDFVNVSLGVEEVSKVFSKFFSLGKHKKRLLKEKSKHEVQSVSRSSFRHAFVVRLGREG
jgi:hypothetical protein